LTDAVEKKDFTSLTHLGNIPGFAGNNDLLKPEGLQHLTTAARELLHWEGMERQVSLRTMRSLLGKAFSDEVTAIRHKKKTVFNPDLVSGPAVRELKALKRDNGAYVIPAIFAPSAKQTNILIGPVCIISKQLFLDKQHDALVLGKDKHEPPWPDFVGEWEKYIKRFDHFVVVKVDNCEKEMAWKAAREAAEFALNLIRVSYGYFYTKNIKLAGGFLQDDRSAQLWFDENGNALFSTAHGPWGSHFDDNWFQLVDERQGGFKQIWSSFAQVLASGKSLVRPVFERQQYAHQLISEAYCEPHDHIRLVRLTAALEAFAMPEKKRDQGKSGTQMCFGRRLEQHCFSP